MPEARYFQQNPPPENPTLLPEDEAGVVLRGTAQSRAQVELAIRFGCGNLEEAGRDSNKAGGSPMIWLLTS